MQPLVLRQGFCHAIVLCIDRFGLWPPWRYYTNKICKFELNFESLWNQGWFIQFLFLNWVIWSLISKNLDDLLYHLFNWTQSYRII